MKLLYFFTTTLLLIKIHSNPLITRETDIDHLYQEGVLDYPTYCFLSDKMENKMDLCTSLPEFTSIPGITQSDLMRLEELCSTGRTARSDVPQDILPKIEPFTRFRDRDAPAVQFHLTSARNIADSLQARPTQYAFATRYDSRQITFSSQGSSDALGTGGFQRLHARILNKSRTVSLTLGNFPLHIGQGLTAGGMAKPDGSDTTQGFTGTILNPSSSEPFGAHLEARLGKTTAIAYAAARSAPKTDIRLAGLSFGARLQNIECGMAGCGVRLSDSSGRTEFGALGLYGKYHVRGLHLNSELSFSEKGYGASAECAARADSLECSFSLWKYSNGFRNPAGRGPAFFPLSEAVTGLRAGEEGASVSTGIRTRCLVVTPRLSMARSSLSRKSRLEASAEEAWGSKAARINGTFEQFWRRNEDPLLQTRVYGFAGRAEVHLASGLETLLRARQQTDGTGSARSSAGLQLSWETAAGCLLLPGVYHSRRSGSAAPLRRTGITLEEQLFLGRYGRLLLASEWVIDHIAGTRSFGMLRSALELRFP